MKLSKIIDAAIGIPIVLLYACGEGLLRGLFWGVLIAGAVKALLV